MNFENNPDKFYNVQLTAEQLMIATAILGCTSGAKAQDDLDGYKETVERAFPHLESLHKSSYNECKVQGTLSVKVFTIYQEFHSVLNKLHEEVKPKTKKIYFCLYTNYNNILSSSGIFESKYKLLDTISEDKIIEIFEREIPV